MRWVLRHGMSLQVYDPEVDQDRGFGLLGDSDHLWTSDQREVQKHQVGVWASRAVCASWTGLREDAGCCMLLVMWGVLEHGGVHAPPLFVA